MLLKSGRRDEYRMGEAPDDAPFMAVFGMA